MATYSRAFLMSRRFWWKTGNCFQFSRHIHEQSTGKQQLLKPLTPVVWSTLKSLGILKRLRGKRGGLSSFTNQFTGSISQNAGLDKQDHLGSFGSQISTCSASTDELNGRNTTNLIEIKKSPFTSSRNTAKPVNFTLLNSRSIRNKTLIIKDYSVDNDVDILALTETWVSDCAIDDQLLRDICPTGYDCYSVPRGSRGGGVALLFKKMLKFT